MDAATKVLDANPPALPAPVPAHRYWSHTCFPQEHVQVPCTVAAPQAQHVLSTVLEEPKHIRCSLSQLPWQKWNCRFNNEVANVNVDEIIPVKCQQVSRKLFGEWDQLMEDVVEWHRRGLHRFHVRMCMCQLHG